MTGDGVDAERAQRPVPLMSAPPSTAKAGGISNDDNGGVSRGADTWDASRAVDELADGHRASGGSSVGAPPPGDIGPYADRKVGHFTQMRTDAPPAPARVGGVSLVAFEAGREPPPMPLPSLSVGTAAPVQRSAAPAGPRASHLDWASGDPMSAAQIHAHAAEGVAGAGGPVPYRAEIERSMGPSAAPTLDRISVHQDSQAQAASAAIGAQAYATGDRIALPPSPSLHLVAHEVAHVAQQAEGVHLAGGVGQEGDPHERAADAFADAVVSGSPVPTARLVPSSSPHQRGSVQLSATHAAHRHENGTPSDGDASVEGAHRSGPGHDTTAEGESGDRSDVERLEVAVRFAENSAKLALGSHVPEFIAARDRLDAEGMQRLGQELIAAVGAMKGAEEAIATLVGRASMSRPGASVAHDEQNMLAVTKAQLKQPLIDSLKDTVEVTVAGAMIPQHFRGRDLAGHGVAKETGAHLQRDLRHHLHSSVGAVRLARMINETLAVGHGVAPGEALLADIWQQLREWQHQPLYLALIRAAVGPNWTLIDRHEDASGKRGAFAEAAEAAEVGGWTGNVGRFDLKEATRLLADGKREGAEQVLANLFSADDASRSRMLMEIRGAGLLDLLCSPLGWAQVKELHDSLEEGHFGGIKQDLQRYFLGSDKFGPSLHQENNRMSAATLIGKAGLVGDAVNFALNAGSFGFYGSYSDNWDARAQGQITDAEYRHGAAETMMRTAVVGGVSLATGGLADKMVRGGAEVVSAGRAIAGGAAGGAAGSVSGLATSDAITMAETRGESGFSSPEAYVEAALVGGAFGGTLGAAGHAYEKVFGRPPVAAGRTAEEFIERPASDGGSESVEMREDVPQNATRLPGSASSSELRGPARDTADATALSTNHATGAMPTAETTRTGAVAMELHPGYPGALLEMRMLGFEPTIIEQGIARVDIVEYVNTENELIRVEKRVYLVRGMRFLDLEHELGHVRQLTDRFDDPPGVYRKVIRADGSISPSKVTDGLLSEYQNAVLEYHNRIEEFLRLKARGADESLLREHASGVNHFRRELRRREVTKGKAWKDEHFPDLADLVQQYAAAGGPTLEGGAE